MIKACFGKSCWWAWRRSIGTSRTTIVEVDRSKIYKNTLVGELNGNATLSKSRLTWIKYGILYVKPKVRLSFARYNDWDCNWYWDVIVHYFLSVKQWKKKKLKLKKNKSTKILTTTAWYLGRICGMRFKFGNRYTEYQQPIDLLDRPFNMGIGYVGIKIRLGQCGPMIWQVMWW